MRFVPLLAAGMLLGRSSAEASNEGVDLAEI